MEPELFKRARECKFTRNALLELGRELPDGDPALDELLAAAVVKRENEAFTHLLLAALGAGRSVDARHLVDGAALLPDPGQLAAAAMHASGNVAQALIEAVKHGGMGNEREATTLLLAAIWCKEKANQPLPPELTSQARILARHAGDNVFVQISLVALANLIRDDGLSAVLRSRGLPDFDLLAQDYIPGLIDEVRASALGRVPERPPPVAHSGYTLRRAAPHVGRNDPCPCGSGKKYKKCCIEKDQGRLQNSSSVPGLTVEELREQKERFLTKDELLQMRSYELARLDPAKVADALKPILINRLSLFEENEAVVNLFERIGVPEALEGHWEDAVDNVARGARRDLLLRLLKLREASGFKLETLGLSARLLLLEDTANPTLELMEQAALEAVKTGEDDSAVELAYALLEGRYPALGIHVARSLLPTTHYFNADVLFDSLLVTRDKLLLHPEDPFQRIMDQRFEESVDTHRDSQALQDALRRLDAKDRELSQSRTQLAELNAELERKEKQLQRNVPVQPASAALPSAPADESLLRELRHRVASLKEALKERHSERNQLRRDLRGALSDLDELRQKTARPPEPARDDEEQAEDNLLHDEESLGTQPVRLPEFPKRFLASLEPLPQTVVRQAMAIIGRIAAGDELAFRGVKRIRANREILRQRVGADHRLLFRLQAETLEVLALINRRDLDRKIKSLS